MTDDVARAHWRKSARSNGQGSCVEIAFLDAGRVGVRDSKDHGAGPVLIFTPDEWAAFVGGVTDGEFDGS